MGMGAYDEDEHERRERKAGEVSVDADGERVDYRGSLEFDDDASTEALLERFNEIKDE